MSSAPSPIAADYVLRISRDLLDIDVLDAGPALDEVLSHLPDEAVVTVETIPDPTARSRPHAVRARLNRREHVISGRGLGRAVKKLLGTTGHMLVMRTAPAKAVEATSSPNSKDSEDATAIQLASPRDLWWYDPRRLNEFSSDPQFPDIRVNHTGVNAILEPLTALSSHSEESLVLHDLGLQLSLRRGFETLLSLQTLQHVSPFPHQIRTAERILRHMRGRALLCDEVGLGKTVETGLILHEYRVRGLVHNALILTPASLTTQWREEMIRKFDLPFVLKNLLRQAGSSGACVLPTLRKISEASGSRQSSDGLDVLIDLAGHMETSEKMRQLGPLLSKSDQTVIFTGFRETEKAIMAFLNKMGVDAVAFDGSMTRSDKESAIDHFRGGVPVLVSTESGGEGRNLQFCHRLINFDIPWNPMRIEQRVGRIHRIGQTHEVNVFNLVAKGTMEQHIVHVLDAKINMFQLVVGELDMILGAMDDARDFEDRVWDIWREAPDDQAVAIGMETLGDALARAKTHYQSVQDVDAKLFTELMADDD